MRMDGLFRIITMKKPKPNPNIIQATDPFSAKQYRPETCQIDLSFHDLCQLNEVTSTIQWFERLREILQHQSSGVQYGAMKQLQESIQKQLLILYELRALQTSCREKL